MQHVEREDAVELRVVEGHRPGIHDAALDMVVEVGQPLLGHCHLLRVVVAGDHPRAVLFHQQPGHRSLPTANLQAPWLRRQRHTFEQGSGDASHPFRIGRVVDESPLPTGQPHYPPGEPTV